MGFERRTFVLETSDEPNHSAKGTLIRTGIICLVLVHNILIFVDLKKNNISALVTGVWTSNRNCLISESALPLTLVNTGTQITNFQCGLSDSVIIAQFTLAIRTQLDGSLSWFEVVTNHHLKSRPSCSRVAFESRVCEPGLSDSERLVGGGVEAGCLSRPSTMEFKDC